MNRGMINYNGYSRVKEEMVDECAMCVVILYIM